MKRSASTALTTKGGAPKKRRVVKTTLQRKPDGPFPRSKKVTWIYENALTALSGAAATLAKSVKLNDAYDFDNSADVGNKQPLYWDTLMTASGPTNRTQFKVGKLPGLL